MCVGVEHPTLRFFARNRGSLLSSLRVEVLFTDAEGTRRAPADRPRLRGRRMAADAAASGVRHLLEAVRDEQVEVAFRFTPQGSSEWSIDDVYVDPFRHG